MNGKHLFILCSLMASLGVTLKAPASESLPIWYMAETADLVVSGELSVDRNPVVNKDKYGQSLVVTLNVQKVLKGSLDSSKINLHYQSVNGLEKPLEGRLREMNRENVIIFVTDVPKRGYYIDLYYGENRIVQLTPESASIVADTLARVTSTARAVDQYGNGGDLEQKVVDSINALSSDSESTKNAGISQLVTLGCAGVPYIIKHMRDYRPYHGDLVLKTRAPDSFEGLMHYNAKVVYDALSDLLSYITGAYFYHSESFNTQADRDADYHGWLVYQSHAFGAFGPDQSPFACK